MDITTCFEMYIMQGTNHAKRVASLRGPVLESSGPSPYGACLPHSFSSLYINLIENTLLKWDIAIAGTDGKIRARAVQVDLGEVG